MHAIHIILGIVAFYIFLGALSRTVALFRWASLNKIGQMLYERPSGAGWRWMIFAICIVGIFA